MGTYACKCSGRTSGCQQKRQIHQQAPTGYQIGDDYLPNVVKHCAQHTADPNIGFRKNTLKSQHSHET